MSIVGSEFVSQLCFVITSYEIIAKKKRFSLFHFSLCYLSLVWARASADERDELGSFYLQSKYDAFDKRQVSLSNSIYGI